MKTNEQNRTTAEQRLRMAQDALEFLRQHPLRKDPGNDSSDAEVLMLALIATTGIPNTKALLGVVA